MSSARQKISRDFLPTVTLLRILGGYPVKIVRKSANQSPRLGKPRIIKFADNETNVKLYEPGTVKDWVIWYSLLMSVFLIFSIIAMTLNLGLESGTPWGKIWIRKPHNSDDKYGLNNPHSEPLFICILIMSLVLILTIRCGSSKFTEWLNDWDAFEGILSENGIEPLEIFDHFRHKLLLIIYWAVGAVFTACAPTLFTSKKTYIVNPNLTGLAQVVNYGVFVSLFMPALAEDVRAHHMLRMLRSAFQMVRRTFTAHIRGSITMTRVEGGRTLTNLVQRQVALAGDCLQGWLSLLVINALLKMSFGVYIALDFLREGKSIMAQEGFVILISLLCGFPLFRLYFEVQAAERIYEEERGLCKDILQMRDQTEDSLVKLELQFLHERLQGQPAMISVGNFFALDKKLLINVLIQVLTLLIAITQFRG